MGTARTRNGKRGARSAKAGGRARRPPRKPGGDLVLRGATKNNLKNLDARIPARSLTVVTGVSGSGKTSLVLDTIFTEGQRRFVESLSTYARRFLGRLERSPVDSIEGLSPAIAIDQRAAPPNPRSTVATATEIYDALRLLYARIGRPHCPGCGKPLSAFSPSQAARDLIERHAGARGRLLAPLFLGTENKHVQTPFASPEDLLRARESLVADGCLRVLVDGRELRLDSELAGARMRDPEHGGLDQAREIHLVVDRVDLAEKSLGRLAEGFEAAYRRTEGLAFFELEGGARLGYSRRPGCVECHHYQRGEPTPRLFSFNHHSGACPGCEGIGERMEVVAQEVVRKPDRPLLSALAGPVARLFAYRGGCQRAALEGLASHLGIDLDDPFEDLPARARKVLLEGLPGQSLAVERTKQGGSGERTFSYEAEWPGILALARRLYERHAGTSRAADLEGIFSWAPCSECGGQRLNPEARAFLVGGRSIAQVARLAVGEATSFFAGLVLDTREKRIARQVVDEIRNRLEFLASVGLHYLSLDRKCGTLTGGEAQRIRLATQLGSRLAGVLYCLDEPTIGLHARDTERLLATLEGMRDLGNTVVVIEHDEGVIRRADHVLDVGPGAGHKGGEIVAAGTPGRISRSSRSLTGRFLSGRRSIPTPAARRPAGENGWITVRGARANNLRSIDASFPLGSLVAVTGVSGSGKSSLVLDCLVAGVRARQEWRLENGPRPGVRGGDADFPDNHDDIEGLNVVSGVVLVDQQPIGRSPKSNPATYSGAFDEIRALFASLPASRAKGFLPARFSFNLAGGRCEACEGRGQILVEMHFLSDVWVTCEDCGGKRFNQETLSVRFKGLTISDVLGLEICEAIQFFGAQPAIVRPLKVLESVGLGYLRLGQSATTLSGGEAQRLKLATELARRSTGRTLYVLDEPTTGLHLADVEVLLEVLHRLVDRGHTVVVVEHHLDVVKNADWVIDLGPEGGEAGGEIVFAGRPEDLARCPTSHTGRFLAAKLARAVSGTL
ncbi:MAG: excinuclease ABC subunit UvrA [Planctomycetes bacterium]|nr:excinuclease ABC subunit UvrA [Planctomycetota bacterium]